MPAEPFCLNTDSPFRSARHFVYSFIVPLPDRVVAGHECRAKGCSHALRRVVVLGLKNGSRDQEGPNRSSPIEGVDRLDREHQAVSDPLTIRIPLSRSVQREEER